MRTLVLALLCLPVFAASTYSDEYQVSVTTVEVWVHATDSQNRLVPDLKTEDFEVYVDGQKVQPSCFQSPATIRKASSEPAKQVFGIYLDLFNTTPSEYDRIRPGLVQFLQRVDRKKWDIFLGVLNNEGRLGIVGPSIDTARLVDFLQRAPANSARDKELIIQRRQIVEFVNQDVGLHNAYLLAAGYARQEKALSDFSVSALLSIGEAVNRKAPAGHKTLLYISGGFNLDPGRYYFDLINSVAEEASMTVDPVQWAILNPETQQESNLDLASEFQRVVGKLNRYDIAVYSLDTRNPLRTDVEFVPQFSVRRQNLNLMQESHDYRDSLIMLADQTGGDVFERPHNFSREIQKVLYDVENYYLLCYQPTGQATTGTYHKIEVVSKVKGVKLRHKRGYID